MDASSAAAWSWPRVAGPVFKNRHTADSFITPTAAATAAAAVQLVHKRIRKATGPPPLETHFFKRMCRRTSANNNNNVVVAGGKYSSTSAIWPAYRTATTTTSAFAMETLLADRAATPTTAAAATVAAAAAAAAAASAMETRPADRATTAAAAAFTMETLPADRATATATMQTLPIALLRQIGAFAGECFALGETSKANLEVTNELHYAINIMNNASSFSAAVDPSGALSNRHMGGLKPPRASTSFSAAESSSGGALSNRHMFGVGVKPPGALATGRIVTRITVTGCTDLKDTNGGYQVLEEAVKRVVQHSIPTLRSIAVKGRRGRDSPRVASILSDLASLAANRNRVAPNLVRVELNHGATAFSAAGKAIEAGLWPALEELIVPNCHAKLVHARKLVSGLSSGRAANLRVLVWDEQASAQHEHLDNAILSALSAGRCPRIERLSFANPKIRVNPSYTLLNTILACPDLRELRLTRKSVSTQRVFYVTCRASRLQTFRQKLATARTKRLGV